MKDVLDYISPSDLKEGENRYDCFFCTDTRSRLYIRIDGYKLKANCFNCGFKQSRNILTQQWKPKETANKVRAKNYSMELVDNIPLEYKKYLNKLGITSKLTEKYNIKWELLRNRLAVKCHIGHILRSNEEKPKWINLGADYFHTKTKFQNKICLTEDAFSAIKVAEATGIFTIALLGTHIKPEVRRLLDKHIENIHVITWFDKDLAGMKATLNAKKVLTSFSVSSIIHTEPKDIKYSNIREILNEGDTYNEQ